MLRPSLDLPAGDETGGPGPISWLFTKNGDVTW